MSTLTVRIIKSFEYRNIRNLIFQSLDLDYLTLGDLAELVRQSINNDRKYSTFLIGIIETPSLKQYRNCQWDTFKLYAQAHGAKTTSLVINMEDDEHLIFQDWSIPLTRLGISKKAV